MNEEHLAKILEDHVSWLNDNGGKRANLKNIRLEWANLIGANLKRADLIGADLIGADLSGADLTSADLSSADLSGANLDYASWPLWCGSIGVKIDTRISKQLVYHAMCNLSEEDKKEFLSDPIEFANGFHHVISGECEELVK